MIQAFSSTSASWPELAPKVRQLVLVMSSDSPGEVTAAAIGRLPKANGLDSTLLAVQVTASTVADRPAPVPSPCEASGWLRLAERRLARVDRLRASTRDSLCEVVARVGRWGRTSSQELGTKLCLTALAYQLMQPSGPCLRAIRSLRIPLRLQALFERQPPCGISGRLVDIGRRIAAPPSIEILYGLRHDNDSRLQRSIVRATELGPVAVAASPTLRRAEQHCAYRPGGAAGNRPLELVLCDIDQDRALLGSDLRQMRMAPDVVVDGLPRAGSPNRLG